MSGTLERHPEPVRGRLAALRRLILDTAAATPGVGEVEETLKWGQPSFLSRVGSTIRIDAVKGAPERYGLYVHCQTDLVAQFREIYGERLTYEGKRALIFDAAEPLEEAMVGHCVALALTYHARKRRAPRRRGPAS